jgi:two-component system KDP operon response regulator KdpE
MGFSAVVLESDPKLAQSLAGGLSSHFKSVHLTRSGDELRQRLAGNPPEVVILDMDYSRLTDVLTDVRNLHHDFPSVPIVCTYRIPDEELWIAALEAGASDVCPADDVQNVLSSALRSVALAKCAVA